MRARRPRARARAGCLLLLDSWAAWLLRWRPGSRQHMEAATTALNSGDTVEVFGLVGAAQHNGKQGEVLRFIPGKGRYAVRLLTAPTAPTEVINVKPANLRRGGGGSVDDATVAAAEVRSAVEQRADALSRDLAAAAPSKTYIDYHSCIVEETRFYDSNAEGQEPPWYHSNRHCAYCGEEHEIHLCCSAMQYTGRKEYHRGELELITWRMDAESTDPEFDGDTPEAMGWGGTLLGEEDENKESFANPDKSNRDLKAFHSTWENAFRWTCCGGSGDSVNGCDHHRAGCSCDYCRGGGSLGVGMGRAMFGMPPVGTDGAPYTRSQANRFLKLHGSPATEWALSEGVPWTTDAHPKLPASFRAQVRAVLLSWQRTPILRDQVDSSVRKKRPFWSLVYFLKMLNPIRVPRQARDKPRERRREKAFSSCR